ncbi:MAG: hypothetical protein KKC80_01340 [Candidatus Margulisbacteria bacterium]|nr:hypothetical protein [Candidatus Margulisiibacteriota bacterium]MBU1617673.1 hypothetical protein [Candidatus Margulisiibacteriota bacterium]
MKINFVPQRAIAHVASKPKALERANAALALNTAKLIKLNGVLIERLPQAERAAHALEVLAATKRIRASYVSYFAGLLDRFQSKIFPVRVSNAVVLDAKKTVVDLGLNIQRIMNSGLVRHIGEYKALLEDSVCSDGEMPDLPKGLTKETVGVLSQAHIILREMVSDIVSR